MILSGTGKPAGSKLLRFDAWLVATDGGACTSSPSPEELTLAEIQIRGDFFASPEEGFERLEKALMGTPLPNLAARFDDLAASEGLTLSGISGKALYQVIEEALRGSSV